MHVGVFCFGFAAANLVKIILEKQPASFCLSIVSFSIVGLLDWPCEIILSNYQKGNKGNSILHTMYKSNDPSKSVSHYTTLHTKFIHKNAQQWVAVNQNKQHGLIKKIYKNKQHAWKAPVLRSIELESQWQTY